MTRIETIKLLEFLSGCYPSTKIQDPVGRVNAWMLAFSDTDAETVYKAARLHMLENKFFPSPSDIRNSMTKASMVFDEQETIALPAEKTEDMTELWEWLWEK